MAGPAPPLSRSPPPSGLAPRGGNREGLSNVPDNLHRPDCTGLIRRAPHGALRPFAAQPLPNSGKADAE
ncbi:protein of unknown function [Streptomyces sp. KY75]|nr:protein of unknown function [Streptomyces sp. KY75]